MTRALTVGEIARRLGWPVHRVDYFVRSRRIEPVARAGILRIYDADVLDRLRQAARVPAVQGGAGCPQ